METEDFGIDWNDARDLVTARLRIGDLEVTAHHHVRKSGDPGTDTIAFCRNSGECDTVRPFIDFGTHLPAGSYRRIAAMLTALADVVDAANLAARTEPLPLEPVPTTCPVCDSSRIRNLGFKRWFCDSCSGTFPGAVPPTSEEVTPNT